MTSHGEIAVDCQDSAGTHQVFILSLDLKNSNPDNSTEIKLQHKLEMDKDGTMILMPSDDLVFGDSSNQCALTSWHLPSDVSISSDVSVPSDVNTP